VPPDDAGNVRMGAHAPDDDRSECAEGGGKDAVLRVSGADTLLVGDVADVAHAEGVADTVDVEDAVRAEMDVVHIVRDCDCDDDEGDKDRNDAGVRVKEEHGDEQHGEADGQSVDAVVDEDELGEDLKVGAPERASLDAYAVPPEQEAVRHADHEIRDGGDAGGNIGGT